jgi:hypothetical protein
VVATWRQDTERGGTEGTIAGITLNVR